MHQPERIPSSWFRVTLGEYFSFRDGAFTKQMEAQNPQLLRECLLADFNSLVTGADISANHLRAYLRSSYGATGHRLTRLLGTETLTKALSHPAIIQRREVLNIRLGFTEIAESQSCRPIIPHFQNARNEGLACRTDFLASGTLFPDRPWLCRKKPPRRQVSPKWKRIRSKCPVQKRPLPTKIQQMRKNQSRHWGPEEESNKTSTM